MAYPRLIFSIPDWWSYLGSADARSRDVILTEHPKGWDHYGWRRGGLEIPVLES